MNPIFSALPFEQLYQEYVRYTKSSIPHITEYTQIINISELTIPIWQEHNRSLTEIASRLNNSYNLASESYNSISLALDRLTLQVSALSEQANRLNFIKQDETREFVWVSETFNTNTFIENASNVIVDTSQGIAHLAYDNFKSIPYEPKITNTEELKELKAIPGNNLEILDISAIESNKVTTSSKNSYLLDNIFDEDLTSYFTIERFFVPPQQKLRFNDKTKQFIYDAAGTSLEDVKSVTANLDWDALVSWGPGMAPYKSAYISFKDVNNNVNTNLTSNKDTEDKVKMVLELKLSVPTKVSFIDINALISRIGRPVIIEEVKVNIEGFGSVLTIAKNISLDPNKTNVDLIGLDILKPVGNLTTGARINVPTDRKITSVTIELSSQSYLTKILHPFAWINLLRRSERRFVLFSSVDREDIKKRVSVFSENLPLLSTTIKNFNGSNLLNGTVDFSKFVPRDEVKNGPLAPLTGPIQQGIVSTSTTNPVGMAGLNIIASLVPAITNVGGFSRDFSVVDQKTGYDVFQANRAAIEINNIKINQATFKTSGTLITRELSFAKSVKSIGLFVEEEISETWPVGQWIKYYISIDGGKSWINIEPLKGVGVDQKVSLPRLTNKVKVRLDFQRPQNDDSSTPICRHIALRGEPV